MSKASCCVHRLVMVDGLGAAHHLDRTVVELGGDARLALVLAPGDHPESRDEDDGRVRVAHRRRVLALAALVVRGVVLPVLRRGPPQARPGARPMSRVCGSQSTKSGLIFVRRKWSGHEVPSAARRGPSTLFTKRSIFASSWTVPTTRCSADTCPRSQGAMRAIRLLRSSSRSGACLWPPNVFSPLSCASMKAVGTLDDLERGFVAGLVVVVPRAHPVVTEQHARRLRAPGDQRLDQEPDVEARTLPRDVDHVVAVDLTAEALLVDGGGDRDHRVRVQMVDVPLRDEGVQRRVDRARARD